jgi:type III restriction enzyme
MNAHANPQGPALHGLADFQREAVDALGATIQRVSEHIDTRPNHRREIALKSGGMLLQAPTGSGKTLMLGRTIESAIGKLPMKCVWFWFAPYSGLVAQTQDSLAEQCPGIRLRDLTTDRTTSGIRDGDVFVQTWGAVAANNKDAKRVRRTREDSLSLDDMLATLRADGVAIGVVIDEAHLNFGVSASAAASFYLDVLQPDFTLLATATPNDEKLVAFEKAASVEVQSRVVVERDRVVLAGLNKWGLMLGYLRMNPGDEALIDFEQATLTAGWTQHRQIRGRLDDKGIGVVPLMLVQVEDQASGGEDPVARVKAKLLEIPDVRDDMIAVHTSGQPDADFHMMAYDHSKQILIFKVAVATGFDAPRAWTLVSVRPNRGTGFGLQIVGRIMRVHPLVRPNHGQDALLDKGYVFLTDPEMQAGLSAAVDELKAVRQSLTVLTDQLDVVEYGALPPSQTLLLSETHRLTAFIPAPPADEADRQARLDVLINEGTVDAEVRNMEQSVVDRAIVAGETARLASQTPLFGNLPEHAGPSAPPKPTKQTPYRLKSDLGLPTALWQEHPLDYRQLNDPKFLSDVSNAFCENSALVGKLGQSNSKATMSLRDLFTAGEEREVSLSLKISNARVAERAQAAFQFNDSIDPRLLERALIASLRGRAEDGGYDFTDQDLRRTIQLAVMREPDALMKAIKEEQGKRARLENNIPIPDPLFDFADLAVAQKAAHGIFPSKMNKPERAFAEMLDADTSGTVKWWLRNPENELWATRMMLPTGQRFFPDFAVGIKGRTTTDGIALVEIKDDGEDGRLHSDKNRLKIQVQHREYRNVFWSCQADQGLVQLSFNQALNLIQPLRPFEIARMVFLHD